MTPPSLRRAWLHLGFGLTAIAAVLAALVVPAVRNSDWWNTSVAVAGGPAPREALRALAGEVGVDWSSRGIAASGGVVSGSTVLVAGTHEVSGRDPRSNEVRWHYRRDNAELCAWTVQDDVVVAAFRHDGGCTDLVALEAGTGVRRWYRNADLDARITLSSTSGVVVAGSATRLVAFDTATGLDRWDYTKTGCQFGTPLPGEMGVAVIGDCRDIGPTLILHHGTDKRELWSVPIGGVDTWLLAASTRVAVFTTDRSTTAAVALYDERGALAGTVTDQRLPPAADDVPAAPVVAGTLLLSAGGTLFGVDLAQPGIRWTAEASGPVALDTSAALAVVVPTWDSFTLRDPLTGTETGRSVLRSGQVAGVDRVERVVDAVITVTGAGTTVYR